MNNKKLFRNAHKMTKEIMTKYPTVQYHVQFGLCLTFLRKEEKLNIKKDKIRKELYKIIINVTCDSKNYVSGYDVENIETELRSHSSDFRALYFPSAMKPWTLAGYLTEWHWKKFTHLI